MAEVGDAKPVAGCSSSTLSKGALKNVALLARLVANAEHCVVVTGAGISTNAGLRDYRGPNGIWTEAEARGEVVGEPGAPGAVTPWDEEFYRLMPTVTPTFTHRAITALVREGKVKYVITQNEDGLHRRSGLPPASLSELHGSAFVEICGNYADGDSDSDVGGSSSDDDDDDDDSSSEANSSSEADSDMPAESDCSDDEPVAPKARAGAGGSGASVGAPGGGAAKATSSGRPTKGAAATAAAAAAGVAASKAEAAAAEKAAAKAKKRAEARAAARRLEREIKEEVALAKRLRPAGCGAEVVRDFVTYHPDTYLRSNRFGRHVTGRACPRCRAPSVGVAASSSSESVCQKVEGGGTATSSTDDAEAAAAAKVGAKLGPGWLVDSTVDFGETPGGFPWGRNTVHAVEKAKEHMQMTDLVLVWGSSLSVLANYFDPWCPDSKWSKAAPHGLRKGPATGGKKRGRGVKPCQLAIVGQGKVLDQQLAVLKIDDDVDLVAMELLRRLGLPTPPPYDHAADPLIAAAEEPVEGEPAAPWRIPRAPLDASPPPPREAGAFGGSCSSM